jgi:hypothetical protein
VHLTCFTPPESTYKSLSIPLPPAARIGEKWRIGLFNTLADDVEAVTLPSILDLTADEPEIIGVWSEGIEIIGGDIKSGPVRGIGGDAPKKKQPNGSAMAGSSKKDKGKGRAKDEDGPKQSRIRREWCLPDGGELRIIEQTSFDLDKVRPT